MSGMLRSGLHVAKRTSEKARVVTMVFRCIGHTYSFGGSYRNFGPLADCSFLPG